MSQEQQSAGTPDALLQPGDPAPYEVIDATAQFPVLLVCDHASRAIPAAMGNLGVAEADLARHVAWDIGASKVVRCLSAALRVPAVLAGYSRLVVDCNRPLDSPSAFPEISDGVSIPGNQELTRQDRQQRADALYWPYHHAVRDSLERLERMATAPALVAIHSFTPVFDGTVRPWHIGVLWDKDPRIPVPLMERLRRQSGLAVGDNQPYSGKHPDDFTIDHHAEAEGLAHISLEIRQDLIDTEQGVHEWAGIVAEALGPILSDPDLYVHWSGRVSQD